ncbi:MAG: uroporphyrinogen-III synthase [Methylocystaceae bacterium]|nr:uroporphyrinogen-III synthase [Methylocystaceae bacterium]
MRLLVTRPKEDADPLAKILKDKGYDPVIFPLLTIKAENDGLKALGAMKEADVQAILFTSANGVRHFARADKRRTFKVLAVGDASAEAAKEAGFKDVESATGDVEALAKLVKDKCDPKKGQLVHVAGSRIAGDLKGLLEKDGFSYTRVVLYSADKTTDLSATLKQDISAGKIDGVLLYSPRTATAFVELAEKAKIKDDLKKVTAYALSQAVADNLKTAGFKGVVTSKSADTDGLLACLPKPVAAKKETADPVKKAQASASATATKAPEKKPGSFKAKLLVASVVILAAVGAGAYFTQDQWVPQVKAELADALKINRAEDIEQFMSTISKRMAALEQQPQVKPQEVDISPLNDKIAKLQADYDALKKEVSAIEITNVPEGQVAGLNELVALKTENIKLNQLVTELNNRLSDLEAAQLQERSSSDNVQALVASLSTLRDVLRTSSSFTAELATLSALAQGDVTLETGVEALAPYADQGVASVSALVAGFNPVANDIVRAVAVPDGAGWVEQTVKNVTSLVTIRRAPGNLDGEGALGVVARAEYNLQNGDLVAALAELNTLEGNPKEAAQGWITKAEARLTADKALAQMQTHILSLLGHVGGQG